ncbi:hypothetical protein BGZ61DRAFT_158701 [Ilyonectria robusta]|uniref:uncharacterized protein n=1 Tax=Ilyonectria robusta TaxID=1079257 RepID=UPI001E8D1ED5|nr:uncharacterized protein BGZ61DRAFT_158701 [Ilyonectria robusta]KAH8733394.1 hypothetical protein BGZ61DRAFT_158701 [Ilyonectria robusta]
MIFSFPSPACHLPPPPIQSHASGLHFNQHAMQPALSVFGPSGRDGLSPRQLDLLAPLSPPSPATSSPSCAPGPVGTQIHGMLGFWAMDIQRSLLDGQLAQLPARLGTTTTPVKAALSSPPTPIARRSINPIATVLYSCLRFCSLPTPCIDCDGGSAACVFVSFIHLPSLDAGACLIHER